MASSPKKKKRKAKSAIPPRNGGKHPGGRPTSHENNNEKRPDDEAKRLPPEVERLVGDLFQDIPSLKKRVFLAAYAVSGGIGRAAQISGVDFKSHYNWLNADSQWYDPAYATAFAKAKQIAGDLAEQEVYKRAFHGSDHPIVYLGKITGTYKQYSDTLACFFLKGLRPEVYRETFEHVGPGGGPMQMKLDLTSLTDAEIQVFEKLLEKCRSEGEKNG